MSPKRTFHTHFTYSGVLASQEQTLTYFCRPDHGVESLRHPWTLQEEDRYLIKPFVETLISIRLIRADRRMICAICMGEKLQICLFYRLQTRGRETIKRPRMGVEIDLSRIVISEIWEGSAVTVRRCLNKALKERI